ncbi:hypothetical protein [Streptomyces longispororuber]|uniref:hypothetical protein n=1 Tax=Streptomyces longispororuber TaxID=68230 RepID=UPI00167D57F4|nr:hypothetical protein [Streptomyces longispororuber]
MLVLALFLSAPLASAGGSTSVLLTSPESLETASLYYADKEYDRLATLLGDGGTGARKHPGGLAGAGGRQITVTWMVHDVHPWRVDRVYPQGWSSKGPVWVHTTTDMDSMKGTWHRADRPAAVRALLRSLHVLGEKAPEGRAGIPPSRPYPARAEAAAAPAAPSRDSTDTGWAWMLPSMAAGALAGAAATTYHHRRRRHA